MTTIVPYVVGVVILVALVWLVIRSIRRVDPRVPPTQSARRSPPPASAPSPYIWGSDLYRRSYENRDVAALARIALGLPPQHDESMWRKPTG